MSEQQDNRTKYHKRLQNIASEMTRDLVNASDAGQVVTPHLITTVCEKIVEILYGYVPFEESES
jgi:hypothetical protein